MRILDKTEFENYKRVHLGKIKQGAIFIYPTDTIYGIGCIADHGESIEKIRNLKKRSTQPFSVIVPSLDWVKDNCEIDDVAEKWLEKLPGPYTFVLKLKNKSAVHENVNKFDRNTVGVRMPDHWISNLANELNHPIVTTVPNIHGEDIMRHPDDLDVDFRAEVNFIIYEGYLKNNPSTIVNLLSSDKPLFLKGKPLQPQIHNE